MLRHESSALLDAIRSIQFSEVVRLFEDKAVDQSFDIFVKEAARVAAGQDNDAWFRSRGEKLYTIDQRDDARKVLMFLLEKGDHQHNFIKAAFRGAYHCDTLQILLTTYPYPVLINESNILHAAIENGYPEGLKLILDGGADCNFIDSKGNSPLHVAVNNRRANLALFLISHPHFDALAADEKGRTPLHLVINHWGTEEPIALTLIPGLLNKGAKLDAKDIQGKTAKDYVLSGSWEESQLRSEEEIQKALALMHAPTPSFFKFWADTPITHLKTAASLDSAFFNLRVTELLANKSSINEATAIQLYEQSKGYLEKKSATLKVQGV